MTREEKDILLEAAHMALHYYQEFLLHDDWDFHLTPEQIADAEARRQRFIRACDIAAKLRTS